MEGLGYIFVYFLKGQLPWQGFDDTPDKPKDQQISECKQSIPLDELCAGLPKEFLFYLEYCRSLGFEKAPDYSMLKTKFRDLFVRENLAYDYAFDWKFSKEDSGSSVGSGRLTVHK